MTAATVGFVLNTKGYGSIMAGTAVLSFPEGDFIEVIIALGSTG